MILQYSIEVVFNTIQAIFNIITLGSVEPVTELPWGIDEPMVIFASTINNLIYYMPWLEVIWTLFLLALGIKVSLFILEWALFTLKLIRG